MPRIAIASASHINDPIAFSGTPNRLARGIQTNGSTVVGLTSQPPEILRLAAARFGTVRRVRLRGPAIGGLREDVHRARTRLSADRSLRELRNLQIAASVRKAAAFDGCVQWGTDFDLPRGLPYVTYDDQTIVQAGRSFPYPWITNLTPRERRWLVDRQKRVFDGAIACCTSTEWAARSLLDDYEIDPARIRVVGIGAGEGVTAAGDRSWSEPRFLFVGFAWERKNGPRVLEAFERVRAAHPDARLDLVGGHPAIHQPGVVGHGRLAPGNADEMAHLGRLFARATCFVLPSVHEPAGMAYVEASAAGIGSIATTAGGAATLVGAGGILVDPADLDALIAAMSQFCDPTFALQMGESARERAELLTWKRTAGRLIGALRGSPDPRDLLLEGSPAAAR